MPVFLTPCHHGEKHVRLNNLINLVMPAQAIQSLHGYRATSKGLDDSLATLQRIHGLGTSTQRGQRINQLDV